MPDHLENSDLFVEVLELLIPFWVIWLDLKSLHGEEAVVRLSLDKSYKCERSAANGSDDFVLVHFIIDKP